MRDSYPSDLNDVEWNYLVPLLTFPPAKGPGGRPRVHSYREITNAIFYITRAGCQWRMLPHDFPNWKTVYTYFSRWRKDGTLAAIHDTLREDVRIQEGRDPEPTVAIIDSQSVKATEMPGDHGYDAGKKINGTKRHIAVDALGLILGAVIHSAGIQDRDGAKLLLMSLYNFFPNLRLIWADGGYAGQLIDWVKNFCGLVLEIIKRSTDTAGFQVLPRRWVVERTFAWLGRNRRLSKDYERLSQTSETFIYTAMIRLMLRRLAPT